MPEPNPSTQQLRLNLPKRALRRLQEVGIYCRTEVRLEHQHLAKRYVVHGTESGGAIRELGRYVTFTGPEGEPLVQLHPVDSIGANGVHAVVVAPLLIKVDMFRYGRTYQLLITKHQPSEIGSADGKRATLKSIEILRGVDGYLDLELYGKDKAKAGMVVPEFYSRAGEKIEIPTQFQAVVQAVVLALHCEGCVHSHYLLPYSGGGTTTAMAFASHLRPLL